MSKKNEKNGFTRNYIGKGTQVKDLDILKVTVELDTALEYSHEYKGKKYLSFEVARMKQPDEFGKTHTCYVNVKNKAD